MRDSDRKTSAYTEYNSGLLFFTVTKKDVMKLILNSPILSGKDIARVSSTCIAWRTIIKQTDSLQRKIQLETPAFQIAMSDIGTNFVWRKSSQHCSLYWAGPHMAFSPCQLPKEFAEIFQVSASQYHAVVYGRDHKGKMLLATSRIDSPDYRRGNHVSIKEFTLTKLPDEFIKVSHVSVGRKASTIVCGTNSVGKPLVAVMGFNESVDTLIFRDFPENFTSVIQASVAKDCTLLLGKDQEGKPVLAYIERDFDDHFLPCPRKQEPAQFKAFRIPQQLMYVDQIIERDGLSIVIGRNFVGQALLAICGTLPSELKKPQEYNRKFHFVDLPLEFARIDQLAVNMDWNRRSGFGYGHEPRIFIQGVNRFGKPLLASWRLASSPGSKIFEFLELPQSFASLIQVLPGCIQMPDKCFPRIWSPYLIAYGLDSDGNSLIAASGYNDYAGFNFAQKSNEFELIPLPKCLMKPEALDNGNNIKEGNNSFHRSTP